MTPVPATRSCNTFLLQVLVLAAMGAFIPQAGGARGAAFAVAAAVLFAVLSVLWMLAARGDRPEYRRASRVFVTGTAAFAVLLAGTVFLPASARVPAWGLLDAAYLAGFAAVIIRASPAPAAALVVTGSITERFGAFIIIVLGETIMGVVTGLSGEPVNALTLAVGLVAIVVGQQLGASIGTSLLNTIFASAVASYLAANLASARLIGRQALTGLALAHGYDTAFWWTAGIFAGGAVIGGALLRSGPLAPAGAPPTARADAPISVKDA
jgi:hypothetical protein